MYDAIIIGAGPAGLTCALYLLRANKKVLVLESKSYGGRIINANKIENYPAIISISGIDFANNLYKQVSSLGLEIKYETVVRITEDKSVITKENTYKSSSIVIATGVSNRKLNLKNESNFIGKGISYCATCDGAFFKGKSVAVVGGGETAIEDALYLSDLASKVYLIHRGENFKVETKTLKELKEKENVTFILNSNIISLNGKDLLESIDIKDNKDNICNIKVDGLFIAIGQVPNNIIFDNVVDLDNNGYIITENEVYTKTEGIYAIGDVRQKELRQLTTAVSDGSLAATIIIKSNH